MVGVLSYGYRLRAFVFKLFSVDQHPDVQMLIEKFNRMNRAMVVINSCSAVIQGSLCGLAYYFAGIPSAFFARFALWRLSLYTYSRDNVYQHSYIAVALL